MPRNAKPAADSGPSTIDVVEEAVAYSAPVTSVDQLCRQTGRLVRQRTAGLIPNWEHEAAATAHGWHEHAHHAGTPMSLTPEDYEAAIAAAISGKPPHSAALSPHHRRP
ncbi:MAG: hypothetical protein AAGA56_08680 [Myxococcota bacterium]